MPTSADLVLVDTSAALALVQRGHPFHAAVRQRLAAATRGLAGHAAVEFQSVLTRLPAPQRRSPAAARRLAAHNFPHSRFVAADAMPALLDEFAERGLAGGALCDGLVGVVAREHSLLLVTCDRRAEPTYRALGVDYQLMTRE